MTSQNHFGGLGDAVQHFIDGKPAQPVFEIRFTQMLDGEPMGMGEIEDLLNTALLCAGLRVTSETRAGYASIVFLNRLFKGSPMSKEQTAGLIDNLLRAKGIEPTRAARAGAAMGLWWYIGRRYVFMLLGLVVAGVLFVVW